MNVKHVMSTLAAILMVLVLSHTACGNPFVPGTTGSLRLAVRPDNQAAAVPVLAGLSRTIMPTAMAAADLVYDYALTRAGYDSKTGTALPFADLTALTLEGLAVGDWNLTVSAFNNGHALYAKTDSVSIVAGANVISWELSPVQTGGATAGLTVDLSWPTAKADGVAVYLSTDVDNLPGTPVSGALGTITETAGDSTARVTMTDQTSGVAYLTLQFALGSATVATVQELVQFYDHRTSVASIVLEAAKFSTAPDAPSALTVTLDQATGNPRLSWADNSNTETGFRVYRDGAALAIAELTTPGTTSYIDSNAGNTAHTYEVRSFNSFGESSAGACTLNWNGSNDSVGFTLNINQPGQNIVFTANDVTVAANSTLTLQPSDATLAAQTTGWTWYVDGTADSSSTGATYSLDPSALSLLAGSHVVSVVSTQNGVGCSGSLRVTITPVVASRWTISYQSGNADGGLPPVDTMVYSSAAASATVAGQGTLVKAGHDFLGWTLVAASGAYTAGTHFATGASLTVGGDMVLKPWWSLVPLVEIPGGTFCRDGVSSNLSTVSSFSIGKFAVTQEQYQSVMTGNTNGLSATPSFNTSGTANLPVENISWYAALVFCNRLSIQEGLTPVYSVDSSVDPDSWGMVPVADDQLWNAALCDMNANGYRLATEAEWMWAAMGGLADSRTADLQNGINTGGYNKAFAGSNGSNSHSDYTIYGNPVTQNSTAPVGSKLPNEFGLYDMSGNVSTWLWDWYNRTETKNNIMPSFYGPVQDPLGPPSGTYRHYRGGHYLNNQVNPQEDMGLCYQTARHSDSPSVAAGTRGLRLVRSLSGATYLPRFALMGEWRFDGTDTNPVDSSDQESDSTTNYNGAVSVSATTAKIANRHGRSATARHYTTQSTIIAPRAMLYPAEPFSLSLWFKPDALPSAGYNHVHYLAVQEGNQVGHFQYWVALDSNTQTLKVWLAVGSDPTPFAESSHAITVGAWNHVAFTWTPSNPGTIDEGTLRVWLDGALVDTLAEVSVVASPLYGYSTKNCDDGNAVNTDDKRILLGGGYDASSTAPDPNYAGGIDDLRIYNRVLSNAEIQQLYQE